MINNYLSLFYSIKSINYINVSKITIVDFCRYFVKSYDKIMVIGLF